MLCAGLIKQAKSTQLKRIVSFCESESLDTRLKGDLRGCIQVDHLFIGERMGRCYICQGLAVELDQCMDLLKADPAFPVFDHTDEGRRDANALCHLRQRKTRLLSEFLQFCPNDIVVHIVILSAHTHIHLVKNKQHHKSLPFCDAVLILSQNPVKRKCHV